MNSRPNISSARALCLLATLLGTSVTAVSRGEESKPAPTAKPGSTRWALLVGVKEYIHLNKLRFSDRDMRGLRERLIAAGFPERQIYLLHDGAKDNKFLPFKNNIERQLEIILGFAQPDDLVVVAFAGHGVHIDGESYLCPADARIENAAATMIPVNAIFKQLEKSPAALKLMLVDACRNDPRPAGQRTARETADDNAPLTRTFERPPEGVLVLTSCAARETSWEDEKLQHGVFMHHLLKGLAGLADKDRNGRVSLLELYQFANLETKLYVQKARNDSQRPELFGRIAGDFDLGGVPEPLEKLITNNIGMPLVLVPRGEFMMGNPASDAEMKKAFPGDEVKDYSYANERPQHNVRITRPFYLGKYEVTRGEFAKFIKDAKYKTDAERDGKGGWGWVEKEKKFLQRPEFNWSKSGYEQTDEHPVVNVSWNDAIAFCAWLSQKEKKRYRLPTEAEWEYACRAGTVTYFQHGNDPEGLARVGNVADRTLKARRNAYPAYIEASDGYAFTAPVGKFPPNAFGVHDMHGNVIEWCGDWYYSKYYQESRVVDPQGGRLSNYRVQRGGSWSNYPAYQRSSMRFRNTAEVRGNNCGLRVVLGN